MNDNERRNHDEARAQPEPLTRLLRDADPAAGDTGLNPIEVAQMRQAITDAARDGNDRHRAPIAAPAWMRPPWMRPALALATIGIVALGLWALVGPPPAAPPEPVADAGADAAPSPPAEPPVVNPDQAAEIADQRAVISARPAPIPDQPVAAAPNLPAMTVPAARPAETVAVTNDPSPPDVRARTVQFIAPRGTRIIWTLNPDFVSPISGPDARQEQGT